MSNSRHALDCGLCCGLAACDCGVDEDDTNTVVVIGSGPAGSISGKDIDRHPVVRLWNHEWQPADRYGSRYDYGLITTTDDAHSAARRPENAWLFYNVPHEKAVSSIDGKTVVALDHLRWFKKAQEKGARPAAPRALKFTRGFAAVAGAIEYLRPRRVIVVGMDILRNGVTGSRYFDPAALPFYVKAYPLLARARPDWASDEMPAGWLRDGPHDYSAEAVLIREIAAEAGSELVWSC